MDDSEIIQKKADQEFVDLVEQVFTIVKNAENYVWGIFKQADNSPERWRRLVEAKRLMDKAKELLDES